MHAHEAGEIAGFAKGAKPEVPALVEALKAHPERVRLVHMGHEVLGAFVLTELAGGVEEISGMTLTQEGLNAGAERAAVEYVVGAAKFARKKAVEVVAHPGSAEARHLANEGFKPAGRPEAGEQRFRIEVKK